MMKVGNIIGSIGVAICLLSVVARFQGVASLFHVEPINIYHVGVGLMVFGCFAKISGR